MKYAPKYNFKTISRLFPQMVILPQPGRKLQFSNQEQPPQLTSSGKSWQREKAKVPTEKEGKFNSKIKFQSKLCHRS